MNLLLWTALIFSLKDHVQAAREKCTHPDFCITLGDGEVSGERGLCLEIPCSFKTSASFSPQHLLWYKCESVTCIDGTQPIFSNDPNKPELAEFKGRVSLLEPDVSLGNCSIIIHDLSASDSGSYLLRVTGITKDVAGGYTYDSKQRVSVTGLKQKPTLDVPQLEADQPASLTCTAPGLCYRSEPTISWMWEGKEKNQRNIGDNITVVSPGAQRRAYGSTLKFRASSEHHGGSITCVVAFKDGATTQETKILEVQYLKNISITGQTHVREGETLSLSCAAEAFPPARVHWIRVETSEVLSNGSATLRITNVTEKDSGLYRCFAKQGYHQVKKKVHVHVMYVRRPVIVGNPDVTRGNALNLSCVSESFPESVISMKKEEQSPRSDPHQATNRTSGWIFIPHVTMEDSGRYVCEATYETETQATHVDVTVSVFAGILNGSRCERDLEGLTCICGSQGDPLPSISWPLLTNLSSHQVQTNVSEDEVWSSIRVKVDTSADVSCVVRQRNRETTKPLQVLMSYLSQKSQSFFTKEALVAFMLGLFLSAIVFLLVQFTCSRKRKKNVEIPLTNGADRGLSKAETRPPGPETGPMDPETGLEGLHYSTIQAFHSRGSLPLHESETVKTEYSEIKRQDKTRLAAAGDPGMKTEDREDKSLISENQALQKEEADQEGALYSNLSEIRLCTE